MGPDRDRFGMTCSESPADLKDTDRKTRQTLIQISEVSASYPIMPHIRNIWELEPFQLPVCTYSDSSLYVSTENYNCVTVHLTCRR